MKGFLLKPTVSRLQELLGVQIHFSNDCVGASAKRHASNLKNGEEVLLLENLRFYKEEELGDREFSKKLSKLADVYVNDAFGETIGSTFLLRSSLLFSLVTNT